MSNSLLLTLATFTLWVLGLAPIGNAMQPFCASQVAGGFSRPDQGLKQL